jgi:hypothetical protein
VFYFCRYFFDRNFGSFKILDAAMQKNELDVGMQRFKDIQTQWKIKEKKAVAQNTMEEGVIDLF